MAGERLIDLHKQLADFIIQALKTGDEGVRGVGLGERRQRVIRLSHLSAVREVNHDTFHQGAGLRQRERSLIHNQGSQREARRRADIFRRFPDL